MALDLSLREKGLNLDDYMKLAWTTYGKKEIPYTVENLHQTLNTYAGAPFGDYFFNNYIYKSEMPDYKALFESVGISLKQDSEAPYFGAAVAINDDLNGEIRRNTTIGSPAYIAGLDKGDVITAINNMPFPNGQRFDEYIQQFKVGETLAVAYLRYGVAKTTTVTLQSDPSYTTSMIEKNGEKTPKKIMKNRSAWLKLE